MDGDETLTIGQVVVAEIRTLLRTTGRTPDALGEGDRLDDLGITSLDLADLIATLNAKLTANPFLHSTAFTDVQTVADLCRAYDPAIPATPNPMPLGDLEATRQRALARRAASQG
jgi:acyl carrier protein